MENKQGGTADIVRPCVECFRADIDSGFRRHSERDASFSVMHGQKDL